MKIKRSLASSLVLLTALAASPPATHVVAVSGEVALTSAADDARFLWTSPDVTTTAPGEFVVAWAGNDSLYQGSQFVGFEGLLAGRKVDLRARPKTPELPIFPLSNAFDVKSPRVAGNASGRFVVAWEVTDGNFTGNQSQHHVRWRPFGADTKPLGPEVELYRSAVGLTLQMLPPLAYTAIALDPGGRSLAAWLQPLPVSTTGANLFMQRFSPTGQAFSGRSPVTGRTRAESSPAVALDGPGNAIVVYASSAAGAAGLLLRRYDPQGRPVGGEVAVSPHSPLGDPSVAASAGGSFVVAWAEDGKGIRAQRFAASGQPDGPALQVSQTSHALIRNAHAAMDSRGDFVVVWEVADTNSPTFLGRVFDAQGVPQGGEVTIPVLPLNGDFLEGRARVALADNGTFLVTWVASFTDQDNRVSARAFRALSNRDRCVYRGTTFLCGSAAGDDLTPLASLGQGTAAGDVPFLADVDGDGADDPCVRHGAAFSCALSGSPGTVQVFPFGAASHVPLLGDVDGDGRADPCVVSFGRFLCNVSHDGTRDLVQPEAFQAGDVPLLGDADGDGRADFCVVRGTTLLCDLDRSGTLTPQPLAIQPGDVVLLGKVDRL